MQFFTLVLIIDLHIYQIFNEIGRAYFEDYLFYKRIENFWDFTNTSWTGILERSVHFIWILWGYILAKFYQNNLSWFWIYCNFVVCFMTVTLKFWVMNKMEKPLDIKQKYVHKPKLIKIISLVWTVEYCIGNRRQTDIISNTTIFGLSYIWTQNGYFHEKLDASHNYFYISKREKVKICKIDVIEEIATSFKYLKILIS